MKGGIFRQESVPIAQNREENIMSVGSKFSALILAAAVSLTVLPSQAKAQGAAPASPQKLTVLTQSVTDTGFTVVWNKPDSYADISDYQITLTGAGTTKVLVAGANHTAASDDITAFYAQGVGDVLDASGSVARKAYAVSMHNYCFTGLAPAVSYTVSVRSVDGSGNLSAAATVTQQTAPAAGSVVSIESTGAKGDGVLANDSTNTPSSGTSNTGAIQTAIDSCPAGGTVLVPAGKIYVTGPLLLHSDMTLDVEGTLLASTDLSEYANPYDTDHTQTGQKSSSLISTSAVDNQGNTAGYQNIRIVGGGTINGNGWKTGTLKADSTHPETLPIDTQFTQYMAGKVSGSDDSTLKSAAANHLAWLQYQKYKTLGESPADAYSARSNLVVINNAANVYVGDGLTLTNPSMHTLGFTGCQNAVVNNATFSTYDCNNGDGINFTNGTGLTVVNSVFNTGDDCVNFNAGLGLSAESNPSTGDAWVFDNYFGRGHGVIAAGSNTAAWIQNILAEDNVSNGTAVGLRCKSQSGNGGGARNIVFRDTALANITDNDGSAFLLTDSYSAASSQPGPNWAPDEPCFHDLRIENCTVAGNKKGKPTISFNGAVDGLDYNIHMDNVAIGWSRAGNGPTKSSLSYLHDSEFHNVVFYGLDVPWAAGDGLSGLRLSGTTTLPDSSLVPLWGADSTMTAAPAQTSVSLSWTAANGSALSGYTVYSGDTSMAKAGTDALSAGVDGLEPSTDYTLTLFAVGGSGFEVEGPSVSFTTLAAATAGGTDDTGSSVTAGGQTAAVSDSAALASNPKTGDSRIGWQPLAVLVLLFAAAGTVCGLQKHRAHRIR